MMWNPPLGATLTTLIVLLAIAAIVASFVWSRRQIAPHTLQGLAALGLRSLAFLLALFFLLQPARLPEPQKITARRSLAIMVDTSGSMSKPGDHSDGTRLDDARSLITQNRVIEQVADSANLALYAFDAQPISLRPDALPQLDPDGRSTDLAHVIEQTARLHQADDLAGILLFTDGHHTEGSKPLEIAEKLNVPLYFVPFGRAAAAETPGQIPLDLAVESVSSEPRIVVGRSAQVVATISADGYPPRQVSVEVLQDGKVVATTAVALGPNQPRRQALFSLRPTALGANQYHVRIPHEEGDTNPANNLASFSIDVVDPINRLVYLDRLRHERRFLKPMLASHRNLRYTAVVQQDEARVMIDGNDAQMKQNAANLSAEQLLGIKAVVIGDLPAAALKPEQIESLKSWIDKGGALLLLAGPASMGSTGFASTPLADVLPVTIGRDGDYVEREFPVELTTDGAAHPAFQKVRARWAHAAPLLSRFNVAGVKPAATVLMASADADRAPIVVSHNYGHGKVAIVLTDSTWRWQLGHDPQRGAQSEHAVFWRQIIDWLLPELEDDRGQTTQVQVIADRGEYEVNDRVTLLTTVRTAEGTVVEDATVEFVIGSPDGRPIRRTGKLEGSAYAAEFDAAHEGQYEIQVTAKAGDRPIGSDDLRVRVVQASVELTQTDPDIDLMRALAAATRGQVLEPSALARLSLVMQLEPRELEIQPNAERDAVPAWDRWWLLTIFIGVMGGEWLLRRKNQWV